MKNENVSGLMFAIIYTLGGLCMLFALAVGGFLPSDNGVFSEECAKKGAISSIRC